LVSKGADLNARTEKTKVPDTGYFRAPSGEQTPLLLAAKYNQVDVMRVLVEAICRGRAKKFFPGAESMSASVTVLHDGKDYLVKSYTNVVFTPASISRLNKPVSRPWRGLGLGVSKKYGDFPALPGVEHELLSIFYEEAGNKHTGVMAGRIRLNEAFNKRSMIDGLREGFPVVHIASHFNFDTANEEKSFLLLGDGNGLTLEELRGRSFAKILEHRKKSQP
jgi:CHAT domain-containing protein